MGYFYYMVKTFIDTLQIFSNVSGDEYIVLNFYILAKRFWMIAVFGNIWILQLISLIIYYCLKSNSDIHLNSHESSYIYYKPLILTYENKISHT